MKYTATVAGASILGFVGIITLHSSPSSTTVAATQTSTTHSTAPTSTKKGNSAAPTPTTVVLTGVHSATGVLENYGYGELGVTVTTNGSKITNIAVSTFKTIDQYSQGLEQQVAPILKGEAIKAQSARIAALTGATYTSEAYAYSLQSALDKLGIK
ncbi:MAG: FMN-binding protein [Acidimicrobiales bacterium]